MDDREVPKGSGELYRDDKVSSFQWKEAGHTFRIDELLTVPRTMEPARRFRLSINGVGFEIRETGMNIINPLAAEGKDYESKESEQKDADDATKESVAREANASLSIGDIGIADVRVDHAGTSPKRSSIYVQ